MHTTFSLPLSALRSVLAFRSTDETRPILNGLCIEAQTSPDACIVATNGHILAAWHWADFAPSAYSEDEPYQPLAESLILDVSTWKLPAESQCVFGDYVTFTPDGNGTNYVSDRRARKWIGRIETRRGVALLQTQEIEGPYPNWRPVFPRTLSPIDTLGLSLGSYAKQFAAISDDLGNVKLQFAGEERAVVVTVNDKPNLITLWMPVRTVFKNEPKVPYELPSFVTGTAAVEPSEAKQAA